MREGASEGAKPSRLTVVVVVGTPRARARARRRRNGLPLPPRRRSSPSSVALAALSEIDGRVREGARARRNEERMECACGTGKWDVGRRATGR